MTVQRARRHERGAAEQDQIRSVATCRAREITRERELGQDVSAPEVDARRICSSRLSAVMDQSLSWEQISLVGGSRSTVFVRRQAQCCCFMSNTRRLVCALGEQCERDACLPNGAEEGRNLNKGQLPSTSQVRELAPDRRTTGFIRLTKSEMGWRDRAPEPSAAGDELSLASLKLMPCLRARLAIWAATHLAPGPLDEPCLWSTRVTGATLALASAQTATVR
ncbi:hypothetical protein BD413DRAFT_281755 [Trametes elegans]|nr:hypothetical protein BD413DRAFT_281755 [Trametes elegans]